MLALFVFRIAAAATTALLVIALATAVASPLSVLDSHYSFTARECKQDAFLSKSEASVLGPFRGNGLTDCLFQATEFDPNTKIALDGVRILPGGTLESDLGIETIAQGLDSASRIEQLALPSANDFSIAFWITLDEDFHDAANTPLFRLGDAVDIFPNRFVMMARGDFTSWFTENSIADPQALELGKLTLFVLTCSLTETTLYRRTLGSDYVGTTFFQTFEGRTGDETLYFSRFAIWSGRAKFQFRGIVHSLQLFSSIQNAETLFAFPPQQQQEQQEQEPGQGQGETGNGRICPLMRSLIEINAAEFAANISLSPALLSRNNVLSNNATMPLFKLLALPAFGSIYDDALKMVVKQVPHIATHRLFYLPPSAAAETGDGGLRVDDEFKLIAVTGDEAFDELCEDVIAPSLAQIRVKLLPVAPTLVASGFGKIPISIPVHRPDHRLRFESMDLSQLAGELFACGCGDLRCTSPMRSMEDVNTGSQPREFCFVANLSSPLVDRMSGVAVVFSTTFRFKVIDKDGIESHSFGVVEVQVRNPILATAEYYNATAALEFEMTEGDGAKLVIPFAKLMIGVVTNSDALDAAKIWAHTVPAHGVLETGNDMLGYVPNQDFIGWDSFEVKMELGGFVSPARLVRILVRNSFDAPALLTRNATTTALPFPVQAGAVIPFPLRLINTVDADEIRIRLQFALLKPSAGAIAISNTDYTMFRDTQHGYRCANVGCGENDTQLVELFGTPQTLRELELSYFCLVNEDNALMVSLSVFDEAAQDWQVLEQHNEFAIFEYQEAAEPVAPDDANWLITLAASVNLAVLCLTCVRFTCGEMTRRAAAVNADASSAQVLLLPNKQQMV